MNAYLVKYLKHYCNVSRKKSTKIEPIIINYYDFTFVIKGRLKYAINGQIYEIRENDALFVSPGNLVERFEINEPVKYVSYNFTAYDGAKMPEGPFLKGIITEQILTVVSCFTASHIAERYSTKEKVFCLLNYIIHEINDILDFKTSNPHIINIIKHINDHITEKITLSSVSTSIGLSKEYTAHIFKKETDMTITDYINQKKMLLANDMIKGTNYPLQVISERLGYDGYSYFSRVYKKHFGISPVKIKNMRSEE